MTGDAADPIMCESCGERVAEVVVEDGRSICAKCRIAEMRARKKPDDGKPPES